MPRASARGPLRAGGPPEPGGGSSFMVPCGAAPSEPRVAPARVYAPYAARGRSHRRPRLGACGLVSASFCSRGGLEGPKAAPSLRTGRRRGQDPRPGEGLPGRSPVAPAALRWALGPAPPSGTVACCLGHAVPQRLPGNRL